MRSASSNVCLFMLFAASVIAQARPAAGTARHAKVYDVGDLVQREGIDGPALGLVDDKGRTAGAKEAIEGAKADALLASRKDGLATIARLVRAFVDPPLAKDEEVQTIGERWIVLLGRAEQHAWLERLLVRAQQPDRALTSIRCRVFSMPELLFLQDVEPLLRGDAKAEDRPATVLLAPGKSTDDFVVALGKHEGVESLELPTLSMRAFAACFASSLNQTAYVRDFEVEVANAAFIANPIIGTVQDGLVVQAAALPSDDGVARLSLDVRRSDLMRPIPTFTTSLGGSTVPVTIQLPNVQSTQVETAVVVPKGHLVLAVLPALAGKRTFVLAEVGAEVAPATGK